MILLKLIIIIIIIIDHIHYSNLQAFNVMFDYNGTIHMQRNYCFQFSWTLSKDEKYRKKIPARHFSVRT